MKALCSARIAAFCLSLLTWAASAAETYTIDPVHSGAVFKVLHLKVSPLYGLFEDITGTITLDNENPANSKVSVKIEVDSLDTGNEKRDEHLEGPDFFNGKEFSALTFESTKIRKSASNKYEVTGLLTLRGVAKEITTTFTVTGAAKGLKGEYRKGGEAVFTLKRSDFGMNYMLDAIGDEVEVRLAVQGVKEEPAAPPPSAPTTP